MSSPDQNVVLYLSEKGRPVPWICLVGCDSRDDTHFVQYALMPPGPIGERAWKGTVSSNWWTAEEAMWESMRGVAIKAANRKHWQMTEGKCGPLVAAKLEDVAQWISLDCHILRPHFASFAPVLRREFARLLATAEKFHIEEKEVKKEPSA